jgi:hypothetical protein
MQKCPLPLTILEGVTMFKVNTYKEDKEKYDPIGNAESSIEAVKRQLEADRDALAKQKAVEIACASGLSYVGCIVELREQVDKLVRAGYVPIGSMSIVYREIDCFWYASQMLEFGFWVRRTT